MSEFVDTCFGMAKNLGEFTFGEHRYLRLRLTENSCLPGQIIEAWSKELTTERDDC